MKEVISYLHEQLSEVAQSCLPRILDYPLVLFTGTMGVGKTTFIRALGEHLQCCPLPNSPTFTLVNTYQYKHSRDLSAQSQHIFHMDFYRLDSADHILSLDIPSYLERGKCWIEWPQVYEQSGHFPQIPHARLDFSVSSESGRTITFSWIN